MEKLDEEKIKELIRKNKLKEVFALLRNSKITKTESRNIFLIENRYNKLIQDDKLGILSESEKRIEHNKITSTLYLIISKDQEIPSTQKEKKNIDIVVKLILLVLIAGFSYLIYDIYDTQNIETTLSLYKPGTLLNEKSDSIKYLKEIAPNVPNQLLEMMVISREATEIPIRKNEDFINKIKRLNKRINLRKSTYNVVETNKEATKITNNFKYLNSENFQNELSDNYRIPVIDENIGLLYWTPFPVFDIKILNNSSKNIYITKGKVKVQKSYISKNTIIDIQSTPYGYEFYINNSGFGNAFNVKIRYRIGHQQTVKSNLEFPFELYFDSLYTKEELDNYEFSATKKIDTRESLNTLGILTDSLFNPEKNYDFIWGFQTKSDSVKGKYYEDKLNEIISKHTPYEYKFNIKNNKIPIHGQIEFNDNKGKSYRYNFENFIPIIPEISGQGGPPVPDYQYNVLLKEEGENYTIPFSISQEVPINENDIFLLKIGAKRSSNHKFKVELYSGENLIFESETIDLELLVTKGFSNMFLPRDYF